MRVQLAVVLLVPALLLGAPAIGRAQNLSIELSMENDSRQQGEAVSVKYTVKNNESRAVAVLKWNTLLEGLINNPFVVLKDGAERKFFGVMVLRTAPIAEDWALIPPNGSLSGTVDLAQAYDLSAAGDYQVRPRDGFPHVAFDKIPKLATKDLRAHEASSNTLSFRMVGDGPSPLKAEAEPGAVQAPAVLNFVGCDAAQQAALNTDFPAMQASAAKVSAVVASWDCNAWANSAPAMTFFGACTPQGLAQVAYVTRVITSRAQGTVILDCSATNSCGSSSLCSRSNVIAFTCLGGSNNTVYLCPNKFFGLPQGSTLDSQESALYHELSHWGFTNDNTYGCKSCESLAQSNPTTAQNTASNYMYFAMFQFTGDKPSCGIEHIAGFGVLLVLAVQITGRTLMRKKAV